MGLSDPLPQFTHSHTLASSAQRHTHTYTLASARKRLEDEAPLEHWRAQKRHITSQPLHTAAPRLHNTKPAHTAIAKSARGSQRKLPEARRQTGPNIVMHDLLLPESHRRGQGGMEEIVSANMRSCSRPAATGRGTACTSYWPQGIVPSVMSVERM